MKQVFIAVSALCLSTAVAFAQQHETANAQFINKEGQTVGMAKLTGSAQGVLLEIEVSGLPASQWVAFHVHQTGSCDHTGGHESAGGHYNPGENAHGYLAANGPHAGDMPNQYVPADGILRAQVFNSMVRLGEGNDIKGKALMIHGGDDDYTTQPTGDAGDRQACAVIE